MFKVAFLGFSSFERSTLTSYFRLATNRTPRYELVTVLTDADWIVVDADHGSSVQLVLATERLAEAVFIGSAAPPGATAWMQRPIDPLHVLRELDAMVLMAAGQRAGAAQQRATPEAGAGPPRPGRVRTVIQAYRRSREGEDEAGGSATPAAHTAPVVPTPDHSSEGHIDLEATLPDARLLDMRGPAGTGTFSRAASVAPSTAATEDAPPSVVRPRASAFPGAAQPLAPSPRPPLALLVDDSEIALRYLQTRLERFGLRTETSLTSNRALELLAQRHYDYLFVDLELGEASTIDGLVLCQQVKRHAPGARPVPGATQVIIVSAHASELDRVRGTLAGCDAYLGKPVDEDELERLLVRNGLPAPAKPDPEAPY